MSPGALFIGIAATLGLGYVLVKAFMTPTGAMPSLPTGVKPVPNPPAYNPPAGGGGGGSSGGPIPKPLTAEIVASARKWAKARGLPLPWVLSTILVESSANPSVIGDGGKSIGLMQVNYTAHTARLAKYGLTKDSLFNIDNNIMIGTEIMREFYDAIVKLLAGRPWPEDPGVLLRLYYRGPSIVKKALLENPPRNPTPTFPQGPQSASNWQAALAKTSAVV